MKGQAFNHLNPKPSLITQKTKQTSTLFTPFNKLMIPAKYLARAIQKVTTPLLSVFTTVTAVLFNKKKASTRLLIFLSVMQWFGGLVSAANKEDLKYPLMIEVNIPISTYTENINCEVNGIYVAESNPVDDSLVKYVGVLNPENILYLKEGKGIRSEWRFTTRELEKKNKNCNSLTAPTDKEQTSKFDVFNANASSEVLNVWEFWYAVKSEIKHKHFGDHKDEIQIKTILPHYPTSDKLNELYADPNGPAIIEKLANDTKTSPIFETVKFFWEIEQMKQSNLDKVKELKETIEQMEHQKSDLKPWIYFLVCVVLFLVLILLYMVFCSAPECVPESTNQPNAIRNGSQKEKIGENNKNDNIPPKQSNKTSSNAIENGSQKEKITERNKNENVSPNQSNAQSRSEISDASNSNTNQITNDNSEAELEEKNENSEESADGSNTKIEEESDRNTDPELERESIDTADRLRTSKMYELSDKSSTFATFNLFSSSPNSNSQHTRLQNMESIGKANPLQTPNAYDFSFIYDQSPTFAALNPFTPSPNLNSERSRLQNMGRAYVKGDVVKMKNIGDSEWKFGIVTSIDPVKIKESTNSWWWSFGSSWDQFKHVNEPRV